MMHMNRESAMPIAELQRLKLKRIKRGECPDCGTALYKTTTGMLGRVKKSIPLNEVGKSNDGRCLVCLPLHPNEALNYHSSNNDENQNNQNIENPENANQPNAAAQQQQSQEAKKAPTIPRIILIYQSNSLMQNVFGRETLPSDVPDGGSKVDIGLFGLDLNDEVSDITLDRRIRHNGGKNKRIMDNSQAATTAVDQNATRYDNSSRHDDDENDHPADDDEEDEMSEKSFSKHNNNHATTLSANVPTLPGALGANTDYSIHQESYRKKMNLLFQHPTLPVVIDHNEPLQVRMARLLEVDVTSGVCKTSDHIPDEEIDSEPYIMDNKVQRKHATKAFPNNNIEICFNERPEEPLLVSPRKLESAEDSIDGINDHYVDDVKQPDDIAAALRKQSVQEKQRKIGLFHSPRHALAENGVQSTSTSSRRIFRPDNLFVSPSTFDQNNEAHVNSDVYLVPDITIEKPMNSITIEMPEMVLDRPDIFMERPPDRHYIAKPSIQANDARPEIFFDLASKTTQVDPLRNKTMDIPDLYSKSPKSEKHVRLPKSVVTSPIERNNKAGQTQSMVSTNMDVNPEVVFDLTAITSLVQTTKGSAKERSYGGGEASHVTDDSLMGYGTENSSSQNHDTEYSAYSSKLLMMLEGTDAENDYSTGSTWPSLRIPRIKADMDDLTSALQSYSNKNEAVVENMTGNVYQETGIPKVVYSSTAIESSNEALVDSKAESNGTSRSLENEKGHVHRVSPLPIPMISPKRSPNPSSINGSHNVCLRREAPLDSLAVNPCEEIEQLLLQLDEKPAKDCGFILSRLTDLLWMSSENPQIQHHFMQQNGASILSTIIWASMSLPRIEEAAFRLFFALIAVHGCDERQSDKWEDELAALIDAQLIAMQTIISDEDIQKLGCRIFCCLASQKGNSNDGSQSGACLAVLNAMDAHGSADDVQEWGLRALYNQCVLSQYADTNKRIVTTSRLDKNGSSCFDVLERIVRQKAHHMRAGGVMEWLYRLYWSLTSSNSPLGENVPIRLDSIRELLLMLEACRASSDASPQLQEAGLGLIANLMRIDYYKSFIGTPDVVLLILDIMHGNKDFVEVQIEACNAVANIAIVLAPVDKEMLIEAGIVRTIVGAMYAFPSERATLLEPALRALLGLASESESAKAEICESKTLAVIVQTCGMDHDSTQPQQELLCMLLASLYSSDRLLVQAVQFDTIGALTAAMSTFRKSDKISDAGCCAYRNLSRNESNFDALIRCNAIGYVVHSMIANSRSKSIQMNGCWVLWNLGVGTKDGPHKVAIAGAMKEIVIAIQTHLDSYEVVDVACGALWGLIHRSNVLCDDFFENPTNLESLVCTLVMHPDKVPLLEKVCGILAYGSRNVRSIPPDVISSGVGNVIETMCHNPRSSMILQHGAHFLRSVVAVYHEYSTECVNVVALLMNTLTGSDVPIPFLGEVLYFLWVMAEISDTAKAKIIAMEGIPIAMSILDQFRGGRVPFVEDPALGLFKELADER